MSNSTSVKKYHPDPQTERVLLRKGHKTCLDKTAHVSKAIKHRSSPVAWSRGWHRIPALPSSTWLGGKTSSPDFSALVYRVMAAPPRCAEHQQTVRDAVITSDINRELCARHCAECTTEITGFNLGSHPARCLDYYRLFPSSLQMRAEFHGDYRISPSSHPGNGRSGMWSDFHMAPELRMSMFRKHASRMKDTNKTRKRCNCAEILTRHRDLTLNHGASTKSPWPCFPV